MQRLSLAIVVFRLVAPPVQWACPDRPPSTGLTTKWSPTTFVMAFHLSPNFSGPLFALSHVHNTFVVITQEGAARNSTRPHPRLAGTLAQARTLAGYLDRTGQKVWNPTFCIDDVDLLALLGQLGQLGLAWEILGILPVSARIIVPRDNSGIKFPSEHASMAPDWRGMLFPLSIECGSLYSYPQARRDAINILFLQQKLGYE
ncbi:hypothetical protein TWF106_011432 [Orbilia oligospora]|uniref:Uncharacterized protein n=1 Tax=Orbilia oligospora TaxID=2813651 RepID=A0A6G1MEW7_ORBOL|nr:hypothetical protein TWF679_007892 [Orbilia oligospora]KAF3208329.1 hypothetical protein TWF106_011432 [Orbilia oligospora]KAF3225333.1 hypothetical protein TWF191_005384 [Orbilia oligospora]KAF3254464.1 hypothetical protein TWF192_003225 [Orbilia oligospora]